MDHQTVFRLNDNGLGPELLTQVFLERGWLEYEEEHHGEHGWHLWWRTSRFRTSEYVGLLPWQRINHFPGCGAITRKDALCRNFRKMRIVHGPAVYNFSPQAYNLPNDYTKFVSEYAKLRPPTYKRDRGGGDVGGHGQPLDKQQQQRNQKQQQPQKDQQQQQHQSPPPLMWICKPAESSRGRGIFIFEDLSDLQYDCNAVVQQYIADPLLIGGYKFDIRVYVAILSFHPLEVYIHEEGLVRFSTEKYDLERPDNVFAHLTNTSINKFSPGYTADKDEVGHGCKWTISQLRRYFLQNNINDRALWLKVTNIIILTMLIQAPSAPKLSNCFELLGFDILVDTQLKPWLLEVNLGPALTSDCQADLLAKKSMLHDLLDLVESEATLANGGNAAAASSLSRLAAGDINHGARRDLLSGGGMGGLGLARDCMASREASTMATSGPGPSRWPWLDMEEDERRRQGRSKDCKGGGVAGWSNSDTNRGSYTGRSTVSNRSHEHRAQENGSTHQRHQHQQQQHRRLLNNGHSGRSMRSDTGRLQRWRKDAGNQANGCSQERRGSKHQLSPLHLPGSEGDGLSPEGHLDSNDQNETWAINNGHQRCDIFSDSPGHTQDAPSVEKGAKDSLRPGIAEESVEQVESKTSNISDSGFSSLSHSSGETPSNLYVSDNSPGSSRLKPLPAISSDSHTTHENDTQAKNSCFNQANAELIRRLTELPEEACKSLEPGHGVISDRSGESMRNEGNGKVDWHSTRSNKTVVVHGNMRRRGSRRMTVASTDQLHFCTNNNSNYDHGGDQVTTETPNFTTSAANSSNNHSAPSLPYRKSMAGSTTSLNSLSRGDKAGSNSNNVSPRAATSTSNAPSRKGLQQSRNRAGVDGGDGGGGGSRQLFPHSHRSSTHMADEEQARLYSIPRNFSQLEAARFPHSYQHARHGSYRHNQRAPHSNKHFHHQKNNSNHHQTPKAHEPNKKVGRFYLVFPFNKQTHKLSQGNYDLKTLIKEVQKHLKDNIRNSNSFLTSASPSGAMGDDAGEDREGGGKGEWYQIWAPLRSNETCVDC